MRVGVDIGGTFTDAVAVDEAGRIRTSKVLTTPRRLHDGVLEALERLDVDWGRLESITHGTTAGLNAFLERRGARVALLTTRGFRDVYELGRASRPRWSRAAGYSRSTGVSPRTVRRWWCPTPTPCAPWAAASPPISRRWPSASCTPTPMVTTSSVWPTCWATWHRACRS